MKIPLLLLEIPSLSRLMIQCDVSKPNPKTPHRFFFGDWDGGINSIQLQMHSFTAQIPHLLAPTPIFIVSVTTH